MIDRIAWPESPEERIAALEAEVRYLRMRLRRADEQANIDCYVIDNLTQIIMDAQNEKGPSETS